MPTDNVHLLHAERPVNANAVERLERLERALELARDGTVVSVAIAMVCYDGAVTTMHSSAALAAPLLGAIDILHARIIGNTEEE